MDLDLIGRIANTKLPLSNGLLPVFEAISNSIHSVDDAKSKSGEIVVEIIRDNTQLGLIEGEPVFNQPITGFVVHDNGIGFTEDNYKSFRTSDTSRKRAKGGKGVGRFLWLKAFDCVRVESVFSSKGKLYRRTFTFSLSDEGIDSHKCEEVMGVEVKTTIRLEGFKLDYRQYSNSPKSASTLGRRIIEHFLELFLLDTCPRIVVKDASEQSEVDLNRNFTAEMRLDVEHKDFQVKTHKLRITHVRLLAPQDITHAISLCAVNRAVRTEKISPYLPNLESPLTEPVGLRKFVYVGYISGKILDASVNAERTRFDIPDRLTEGLFQDELCLQDILDAAIPKVKAYLDPFTAPLNEAKKERITHFVTAEAPQYRPLLKHKSDRIDSLRSNLTEAQLDVELYKIGQEWDLELRDKYRLLLLTQKDDNATTFETIRQRYEKFLAEWNEAGISKLARYVVHRRSTLEFLDDHLKLKANGKYNLEDAIHEIIFPLRATSDDVRMENMNLWILDEKLAYHYYLASDKQLDQVDAIDVDSKDRPDILIFDRPFAFAESGPPFSAIVIVEFKRPARDDYSERDNKSPIVQVYEYISLLKDGKAKDRRGRPITIPVNLPIYAYIVCDLTPSLQKQASNYQLTKTPDSLGYFGYHREHGAYIEIVSFDKLIEDAKRRNKILFDKLGLEGESHGIV